MFNNLIVVLNLILLIIVVFSIHKKPEFLIILMGYSLVLSQSFPITYIDDRPINMSTDHLIFLVIFYRWLISKQRNKMTCIFPSYTKKYILFTCWAIFTLILCIYRNGFNLSVPAIIEMFKWLMYTLIFVPSLVFIESEKSAMKVLKHLLICSFIVVTIGYLQWILMESRNEQNIVSTFASIARDNYINYKNNFAIYVLMFLMMFFSFYIYGIINPCIGFILITLYTVIILFNLSRISMICMVLGVVWIIICKITKDINYFKYSSRLLSTTFLFLSIIFLVIIYSSVHGNNEITPVGRFLSLFKDPVKSFNARGIEKRYIMIEEGLENLWNKPIFGYGFNARAIELPQLTVIDNFFLDVAVDTGFVGLFFMIWFMLDIFKYTYIVQSKAILNRDYNLSVLSCGVGTACICYFLSGFSGSIPYTHRIIGTLSILLSIVHKKYMASKSE